MRRFLVGLLAVIGFIALLGVGGIVALFTLADGGRPAPPARIVLEVDWRQLPQESTSGGTALGLDLFGARQPGLSQTVAQLHRAAADPRVAGMIAVLGDDAPGLASVQELRDAINVFRTAGKFAIAYTDSFGGGIGALQNYYLATAFEKIWVQPSGDFAVVGLAAQVPFLKDALDRIGITVEGGRRMEYKTAPNSFTETGFTPAHRENLRQLLDGLFEQMVNDIASARGVSASDVRGLIDRAPLPAPDAMQAKLLDRTLYRDEARGEVLATAGNGAGLFPLGDYASLPRDGEVSEEAIALIVATGTIVSSDPEDAPLQSDTLLAADRIVKAIEAAARDGNVKALVVRLDSPGGSYVASDTLRRALERARAAGKPVIVSIGDVAASGGYFAALPADVIMAQPASITGSIGVFSAKPVVSDLVESLGINVETLTVGANAAMYSPLHSFTPEQQAIVDRQLDRIYRDFTAKVAAARTLDAARLDQAARGRVFTGAQAKAAGLVDEMGGLHDAIALAKVRANIPASRMVQVRRYPAERDPFDRFMALLFGDDDRSPRLAVGAGASAQALLRRLNALGLYWHADAMRLPPLPPLWQ